MIPSENPTVAELQAELARIREELQMRDQLVQQLSQELFRLVKGNSNGAATEVGSGLDAAEVRMLHEQLQAVEQQVRFYQAQISERDNDVYQLRQSVQELTERSRMLEQVVQELPKIYREKFEQRLVPIKEKMAMIQQENRRLHAELQSANYRLAVKNRQNGQLDLPTFPRAGQDSSDALPNLNLGGA